MTEAEARDVFESILDRLGVRSGDRIMLGIDMGKLPLPAYPAVFTRDSFREREARWCGFVLRVLLDRLGSAGSLLVPSFTYSCGKPGSTFVAESTPSENGPFTEYFRTQAGVTRSLHPIFSLSGIGRDASALLDDVGCSAFGAKSPFGRFARYGIRFLCLGVELRNSITYVHHLEQSYGCPHRYNKTFDTIVSSNGRAIEGPWFAYVGFRGFEYTSDISSLQRALDAEGLLTHAPWEGRINQLVDVEAVDTVGYELLAGDSGAFVNRSLTFHFDELPAAASAHTAVATVVVTATETERP